VHRGRRRRRRRRKPFYVFGHAEYLLRWVSIWMREVARQMSGSICINITYRYIIYL